MCNKGACEHARYFEGQGTSSVVDREEEEHYNDEKGVQDEKE